MQIKLPVLDLCKDYVGVLKETSIYLQVAKVYEELNEYAEELNSTDEACDEWFDIVQSLAQLGKLEFTPEQIQQTAQRHYAKLESRDRTIIGSINISVEVEG
jgi:hypothetical protein